MVWCDPLRQSSLPSAATTLRICRHSIFCGSHLFFPRLAPGCFSPGQSFVEDGIKQLVVVMCDDGEVARLCAVPFTPAEVASVWDALLWKGWMADVVRCSPGGVTSVGAGVHYFRTLFAFMTTHERHRHAAAAMWALAHRVGAALAAPNGGLPAGVPGKPSEAVVGELQRLRVASLATACASLALVPREQAYVLGREWWPRCPEPLSIVSIDDVRGLLVACSGKGVKV